VIRSFARTPGVGAFGFAVRAAAVAAGLALAIPALPAAAQAKPAPDGFADLADQLLPAVVNISTTTTGGQPGPNGQRRPPGAPGPQGQPQQAPGPNGQAPNGQPPGSRPEMPQFPPGSPFEEFFRDFFDRQQQENQPRRSTALGSGFIIDPAGLVVTNNHVIEGADEITVILHDDTSLKAELVGRDPKTDLALLRVKSSKPLPYVKWGSSDELRVGDWVVAIGNPFGLGGTVTAGIISARARNINAGPYDDFLQTDAAINKGNSGGPMFNLRGEVVGINTAIFSPTGASVGIGFAIPSKIAQQVVGQLKDFGRTRRGWLGVRIQEVTPEIAESLGLDKARGALIASVSDPGPAKEAGIQAGDVVLTFNNQPVGEMRTLPRIVADTAIGGKVPVSVWRQGKELKFSVKVGELEAAEEQMAAATPQDQEQKSTPQPDGAVETMGLTLSQLGAEQRQQFELPAEIKGVVVTGVKDDSVASEKGIRPGDVIREVSQEEVSSPQQVAQKVADAKKSGRKSVLLLIDRQGDLRFVALAVDQG